MTLDGFLTFLTLIIAAYGVATSVSRLRLRLHVAWLAVLSLLSFAAVCALEIPALRSLPCLSLLGGACRFLVLDAQEPRAHGEVAFGVVVIWAIGAWLIVTRLPLAVSGLPTLRRLVDELLFERRFAELIQIVEPHLDLLVRATKRQFRTARLYDWFAAFDSSHWTPEDWLAAMPETEPPRPTRWDRIRSGIRRIVGTTGRLLPKGQRTQTAADEILRELLLNPSITEFIALYRAAFGVRLLGIPVDPVHDFCDSYLTALVADPKSTFYAEIRNNQNYASGNSYAYPEANKLLHFLFGDARTAEKLGVWKPVGEWLMAKLRPVQNPEYTASLNYSSDSYDDDEKWRDPAYVVIWFFDLMVSAAEYQGVQWHMWLYYFPHFMDRLLATHDESGPDVDPSDEWPTRGTYLMYSMISCMTRWISAVEELPETSPHRTIASQDLNHENGNIPKSAILALGSSVYDLFRAQNVSHRFRIYIYEIILRCISDLPREGELAGFRAVLVTSIVRGGPRFDYDFEYGALLRSGYLMIDHVLRERLDDYAQELAETYPH